jgi:hypothetical protein
VTKKEESILVDEELQGVSTSSTIAVEVLRVEGKIISEQGAPSHIQKAHPTQQIICNMNERVTRSLRQAYLSCFTNTLFITLFEPLNVEHTLFDSSWVNTMHEELENFEKNQVWTLG